MSGDGVAHELLMLCPLCDDRRLSHLRFTSRPSLSHTLRRAGVKSDAKHCFRTAKEGVMSGGKWFAVNRRLSFQKVIYRARIINI